MTKTERTKTYWVSTPLGWQGGVTDLKKFQGIISKLRVDSIPIGKRETRIVTMSGDMFVNRTIEVYDDGRRAKSN